MKFNTPSSSAQETSKVYSFHPEAQRRVTMRPNQFLELVGSNSFGPGSSGFNPVTVARIEDRLSKELPIDPLWVELTLDGHYSGSHEGRNRAFAALKLGVDEVPVIVFYRVAKDKGFANVNIQNNKYMDYHSPSLPVHIHSLPSPKSLTDVLPIKMVGALASMSASVNTEPLKKYTWFKYKNSSGKRINHKSGKSVTLKQGDIFGVREINKKIDRYIVLKEPTLLFSVDVPTSDKILDVSKEYKGKVVLPTESKSPKKITIDLPKKKLNPPKPGSKKLNKITVNVKSNPLDEDAGDEEKVRISPKRLNRIVEDFDPEFDSEIPQEILDRASNSSANGQSL